MTVKELMEKLGMLNPELLVIGYCERSEDDFFVTDARLAATDGSILKGFYNQGSSVTDEMEPQQVVVIC